MSGRTAETAYVLSRFEENFRRFEDRKIVLCGDGPYTGLILERFGDRFGFAGLLTDDPARTAARFPGLRLFTAETLGPADADLVILSEHKPNGEADYPMLVTLSGIVTEVSPLQYPNA